MPGQAGKLTLDLEDNDAPTKPQVTFVADEFASENGEDVAILQVNRLGDATQALDVPYEIEGKAENNLDLRNYRVFSHLRLASELERSSSAE